MLWPEFRNLKAASLSKSMFLVRGWLTNSATKTVVPMLSNGSTKVSLPDKQFDEAKYFEDPGKGISTEGLVMDPCPRCL